MSGVKILCSFPFVRKISRVSDGNKIAKTNNSPLRGQVLTGAYQFFLFFWKGPCFFDTFVLYLLYLYLSKNSTSIIKKRREDHVVTHLDNEPNVHQKPHASLINSHVLWRPLMCTSFFQNMIQVGYR